MSRPILTEDNIHPYIRNKIASNHTDIIEQVQAAMKANDVLVIGMAQNPFPKKARKLLKAQGVEFAYLEYGNYFSDWRRRNALKMWTGWPTFPMIFVKQQLIGGYEELKSLLDKGELSALLSA